MALVNIRTTSCDVYIGRGSPWGNPFSFLKHSTAVVVVKDRNEAVECFDLWLQGEAFTELLQEQRAYILQHVKELKGRTLGCYCAPDRCHGEVLERLAQT